MHNNNDQFCVTLEKLRGYTAASDKGITNILFAELMRTLQFMKSIPVNEGEEKRTQVMPMLSKTIKKCLESGTNIDTVKSRIMQLYDEELLINEAEYR